MIITTCAWAVAQLCLTFCNAMDCSLPGSSVHGISQARKLEWVAISFSRGSSRPRNQTLISCVSCASRQIFLPPLHLGSWLLPWVYVVCKQSLVNDFIHLWNHCLHRVYILIRYNFGENWDRLCEMKHFLKINYGIYACSAYATNKKD